MWQPSMITSFSENVEMVETSYKMFKRSFIILRSGVGVTSFTGSNSATFSSKKW